ncbi:hypothetical protein BDZ89DRAFT_1118606 [Hymenopellis radicata]|nr:hypothetical protein BDZ89DRAFT_1118606 [Hymenopellis radicata]
MDSGFLSESQFDNILLDTKGIPFTSEIDQVLLPHRDTILRIISDPASVSEGAPVAHGATLLLASRMKAESSNAGVDGHDLLQHAWMRPDMISTVDVDKEAVSFLEDRMFSQSKMAGVPGNRQWGLDIRSPQSDWIPYDEGPERWKDNLRVGLDKERDPGLKLESSTKKRPPETQDASADN